MQQLPPPARPDPPPWPALYDAPAPPHNGATGSPHRRVELGLVGGVLLATILLLLAVTVGFLLLIASLTDWGGRAASGAGQQVGGAVQAVAGALVQGSQEARDRFDPSHPPRSAIVYDTEIEDLLKLNVGQALPGGRDRTFSLAAIKSRDDVDRPETSRYVVLHSELRQPNETKVLGLTVRKDAEPRDDYLYQGESFRLGGQVYRVNWISPERQQVALIQVRGPDRTTLPIKFVYD